MEGYLHLRINPWMRRLLTRLVAIIPAVIVILINGENNIDSLLVLSQVVLSLQLGFAIIPLIHFVSDKRTMGEFAIKPLTRVAAWVVTSILVYLNMRMVSGEAIGYFNQPGNIGWKILIIVAGLFFVGLLLIALIYPFLKKRIPTSGLAVHPGAGSLQVLETPVYNKIAVAVDFGEKDQKLLAHAAGQAHKGSSFILIHIVESVPARLWESESDDLETRTDTEELDAYIQKLKEMGYEAKGILGFNDRAKEIARIVKESGADLLVIGAHGHSGIKDWLYGQTIESVRHDLKIPVLVVHV
jgi:manganese transport protein